MLRQLSSLGSLLLLFTVCLHSTTATPAALETGDTGTWPATAVVAAAGEGSMADCDATGGGWWQERKQRLLELVMCALSSANVTYMLLAGIPGAGGAISLAIAAVGVLVCL